MLQKKKRKKFGQSDANCFHCFEEQKGKKVMFFKYRDL